MQPIFIPGTSFLHRLHPLTKLTGALLLVVASYALPWASLWLAVVLMVVALAAISGVARPLLRAALVIATPVLISLLLIQGLLFPPTRTVLLADFGWYQLWADGFLFALRILLRLLVLVVSVLLLLMTTHPSDLVDALTARGLPRSIGYVLLVSIQLVPDMSARATAIVEAQRSRGLETQGFFRRLTALPSLVSPLIIGALSDVEERAMALESRAFSTPGAKTTLRELHDTAGQRIGRALMLLAAVALIVARFTILRGLV